ncbi:hypothetical protein [Ensifer sp. SL37]|uniref:hypothetical protein n=1 Tax=Ensifer sp. SL37 TaxID=2995137 RepID=UPI0022723D06|nr:hypothetical protein [Ensifer sp. SL37]MCY1741462.1 hypothetical protein [Ensifer sp. SL37]
MEKDITDRIKKKFLEYRNYRSSRQGDPWEITQAEWVEFFTSSEARSDVVLKPRGLGRIYRHDEALPWSIDNLAISDKQIRKGTHHQYGIEREADATLSRAFDRFAIEETQNSTRTLTRKQWIAELQELRRNL